jgi:hypothetical protein
MGMKVQASPCVVISLGDDRDALPVATAPQPGLTRRSCGQELAIGAEPDAIDLIGVTLQGNALLARAHVPDRYNTAIHDGSRDPVPSGRHI